MSAAMLSGTYEAAEVADADVADGGTVDVGDVTGSIPSLLLRLSSNRFLS